MSQVVIFGIGEIAEVVHYFLTHDSPHDVVAFTVDKDYITGDTFAGLPVVPFEEVAEKYPPDQYSMFVAIGYRGMNRLRQEKYDAAKTKGYKLVTYISSSAVHWPNLKIGDNCFVMENMTIQPFVTIGNNVILWSGNHIGHHVTIKDHCFLTSHVVVSGGTVIGEYSFIGVNATLRDHITIAPKTLIGAGALILADTKEGDVYPGTKTAPIAITSDQVKNI